MQQRVILLHLAAPSKPATGMPCNGCGACCTSEPCPLGMLISRRFSGRCAALLWHDGESRYRCGAVVAPQRFLRWLPRSLASRLASRWIAAAKGCDAAFELTQP